MGHGPPFDVYCDCASLSTLMPVLLYSRLCHTTTITSLFYAVGIGLCAFSLRSFGGRAGRHAAHAPVQANERQPIAAASCSMLLVPALSVLCRCQSAPHSQSKFLWCWRPLGVGSWQAGACVVLLLRVAWLSERANANLPALLCRARLWIRRRALRKVLVL